MIWLIHFLIFDGVANSFLVGARAHLTFGARSVLEIAKSDPKNVYDFFASP